MAAGLPPLDSDCSVPFGYINNTTVSPVTCTLLYHVTKVVVVLVILVVFSVYARCYKLRVREEVVNIVTDIYTKYLDQKDEQLKLNK